MTIEFKCSCGAVCRADESQVGHLVHCEACGLDVPVPSPEDAAGAPDSESAAAETAEGEARRTDRDDTAEPDADRPGGEPSPGRPGLDALQEQIVSEEDRAAAAEEAEQHRTAAEALRQQLGGGGAGDIAAHIHDGEDDAARSEAAALAEKRRGDAEALRQQLGGGGAADIAAALEGRTTETGATGPADGAPPAEAPAVDAAAIRAGAARRRPGRGRKVLRGYERASHHIGVKRVFWLPSLLVGLLCVGVGVLASVFHIHPVWLAKEVLSGQPSAYEQHKRLFEKKLADAHIPRDGFEIVQHGGEAWAVPEGAAHRKTASGRVYYSNPAGFDEPAVNAEDYAKCLAIERQSRSTLVLLGGGLVAVGLALLVLGIVTLRDVRIVAAARAGVDEETPAEPGQAPAEAADEEEAEAEAETPPEGEEEAPPEDEDAGPAAGESPPADATGQEEDEAGGPEAERHHADAGPQPDPTDGQTDEQPPAPGGSG